MALASRRGGDAGPTYRSRQVVPLAPSGLARHYPVTRRARGVVLPDAGVAHGWGSAPSRAS